MAEEPLDQGGGDALRVKAEALGEPGQRRFRLMAIIDGETRIVWMEKEQLGRLAQALEQVLDNLPDSGPDLAPDSSMGEFELETPFQMRAGRMELGYDEGRERLIITAHSLESDDSASPAFVCRISPGQARSLSEQALLVVTAGRPLCPLCGRPVDASGHSCEKQNGHFPHRIEEVQADENDE